MSVSILDTIEARRPGTVQDSRLTTLIALAEEQTGTAYGDFYNLAVALLVCHWLERDGSTGSRGTGRSGQITSEKEGQLSRSYGQVSGESNNDLASTSYGLELQQLRKTNFKPVHRQMPFYPTGITRFQ